MKRTIIKVLSFLLCMCILLFLGSNMTFQYGESIESLDNQIQWQFFHEEWIDPEEAEDLYGKGEPIQLPHKFINHYHSAESYGTYIAKLSIPEYLLHQKLAAFIPFQYGSYNLYINDELILQNGVASPYKEDSIMEMSPQIGQFILQEQDVYITLQLSNYSSIRGGFAKPLQIGEYNTVKKNHYTTIICYSFIIGIIFILGIFLIRLALVSYKNTYTYLLAGICITFAIRSTFARPFFYTLTKWDINWEIALKIEALSTAAIFILFIMLAQEMLKDVINKKYLIPSYLSIGIQIVLIFTTEPVIFQKTFFYIFIFHLYYILYSLYLIVKHFKRLNTYKKIQFLGIFLLSLIAIYDVLVIKNVFDSPLFIPIALVAHVMLQVVILTNSYATNLHKINELNEEVMCLNASLEQKVARRTIELKLLNERLEILASKDPLTGISNRYIFDKRLKNMLDEATLRGTPLTLFMLDLDFFKQYNDSFGHYAGDELLKNIVHSIQTILPENAVFARYGGEEFAILITEHNDVIRQLGESIVTQVENQRFKHPHCEHGFATISVGAYTIQNIHSPISISDLVNAADQQLYNSKQNGKNCFSYAYNHSPIH